ncbi:MAG TPA: translocation/assembly module TamB domain-containing protein, partial [Gemmatimonadales bacterium]
EPDVTVLANIGGTLLVPKLTLSADKRDLSQTELISYLLFGQPSFELASDRSSGQGNRSVVLDNAVAVLSNAISGELERTVVSDLGVPLDYFEFRPDNPTDPFSGAQLAAGWQIGRKTFLVLNAGFCQGTAIDVGNALGASLQYRFNSEWRTEASFEPVRSCDAAITSVSATPAVRQVGLDLFWEKRY